MPLPALAPRRALLGLALAALLSPAFGQAPRQLQARLFIDALGAQSPHAAFDLLCPTVGGVLDDLELGRRGRAT